MCVLFVAVSGRLMWKLIVSTPFVSSLQELRRVVDAGTFIVSVLGAPQTATVEITRSGEYIYTGGGLVQLQQRRPARHEVEVGGPRLADADVDAAVDAIEASGALDVGLPRTLRLQRLRDYLSGGRKHEN